MDDANDVWIYHRKDHIKQPRSRKSYAVEARFLLSGMIFIDLFYTIQVSKDFNGLVKTNAMIFPDAIPNAPAMNLQGFRNFRGDWGIEWALFSEGFKLQDFKEKASRLLRTEALKRRAVRLEILSFA